MPNITITALATNYPHQVYRMFLDSLYRTGYDGEVYIFIYEKDLPQIEGLKANFITIDKYLEKPIDIHIQNYRIKIYKDFFESNSNDIPGEYILFTDLRDVIFQKNINDFPLATDKDIFIFEEDYDICNCSIFNKPNYDKLKRDVFPEMDYDKNRIICSGTILIKKEHTVKFLTRFYEYIVRATNYLSPNEKMSLIADQTMLNHMYYTNDMCGLEVGVLNNEDNLINTMGYAVKPYINTASVYNGYIVNKNKEISYIGHQYDRLDRSSLIELYNNIFSK